MTEPTRLEPKERVPNPLPVENIELYVPEGKGVAIGWSTWAAADDGFEPPKFDVAKLDDQRVQGIFADYRYDAALMQRVKAPPHVEVTFSMRFRVEPDGATERTRPAGMVVGVGIDPYGGENPRGDGVQWALRDLEYSKTVEASVRATAQADVVTVFVRSVAFIPASNTATGLGAALACVAQLCGRVRYTRTYLLLPPGSSQPRWERAARTAVRNNWTVGGSADDAGLASALLYDPADLDPPLPVVRAVNPIEWDPQRLNPLSAQWFLTNYPPGVNFIAMSENDLDL